MGIFFIKNVPFSPQLNPIENVFSRIKDRFKRNRLQAMQTGAYNSAVELIESAIKEVNSEIIKSIVRAGLKRWTSSDYKSAIKF